MAAARAEVDPGLHVHPVVASGLLGVAALADAAAWVHTAGSVSLAAYMPSVGLSGFLVAGALATYWVPLHVTRYTRVYVSSVAYYLLAALVPPELAAAAAAVASLAGEWSVRRRSGTLWPDVGAQAARRSLVVLAASVVAHISSSGTSQTLLLVASALVMGAGDVLTFPIMVHRLARKPPLQIVVTTARHTYLVEGWQYLLGVLAALAWGRQFWSLALLSAPTVLVYMAFRANALAQDARAAAQNAADALRDSEARYRGLFENASDLVFTMDRFGKFTSVNVAIEKVLGYTRDDLLHMNVGDIMVDPTRTDVVSTLATLGSDGGAPAELEALTKDGRVLTVEISGQAVFSGQQQVGFQGIARDVTERRKAEAERTRKARELAARILEAQESERKRISRELHDETAQSLSILLTNVDLLEGYVPPDASELRTGLRRIGDLAKRVLDEVRTLSHDLRPTILDDVGLVPALAWLAREYEVTYGGKVYVDADTDQAACLSGDEELALFRITQEALTNSGKHGGADEVVVSLRIDGDVANLEVQDNGTGFDVRDEKRPSREGHLGLYGMRERAALLGGTLDIASTPGQGACMRVHLPLSRSGAQDLETPALL